MDQHGLPLILLPQGMPLVVSRATNGSLLSRMALITRSEDGIVVLDLDGDGFEQTGWVVFYLHIETRDRIPKGTFVQAGDHIGHPSCEGGLSNGTHVHIARKYNGEWISADGSMPFILDGWVSEGFGIEYDGYLKKNNQTIEAWDRRDEKNQIQR